MQDRMTADAPWTAQQREALQEYSSNEYLLMNAKLRGVVPRAYDQDITDPDPARTQQRIKDAKAGLRPLPESVRVFRNGYMKGLGLPKAYTRREQIESLRGLVGKTHKDDGFTSTSLKRPGTKKFGDVRLDIAVPAGTHGAFIEGITSMKHEHELVLAPGLHFKVLSLDESGAMPILKVRVIPA